MARNLEAVLITYLKDILFSEEEIVKNVTEREHIFEIKDKSDDSLGFIALNDLKAYVFEHEEEADGYLVRPIDDFDWIAVFEHPLFQRRKPQLVVPPVNLKDNDDQQFFILKHGQKSGPYKTSDLTTMLDNKEILLTDMASYNGGHTWMKLYQVDSFDRRTLKESDQLPGLPGKNILHANESVIAVSPETEAISSLAYLSNVKRGKSVEKERIETYQSDVAVKSSSNGMYKWLLILSMIGIGYFLFHIKNQLSSPFQSEKSPIGEQADMLTPVEMHDPATNPSAAKGLGERNQHNQVNDQQRSVGKFDSRPMNPLRTNRKKSFMDSGKYKDVNKNGEEDPNYFYDNTSAMELDPVRSQVSKENFDNGGAEAAGPIPSSDNLFESEVSN